MAIDLEQFSECADLQSKGSLYDMSLFNYDDEDIEQDKKEGIYVKRLGGSVTDAQLRKISDQLYGFSNQPKDNNLILAHWLVEHGVTGWENITMGGKPFPYTDQNKRFLLMDIRFRLSVNEMLIHHASNYANYVVDKISEDVEQVKKP